MYSIDTTKRFDKDLKRCLKRGLDLQHIYDAIALLRTTGTLPVQYRPPKLSAIEDQSRLMGQTACRLLLKNIAGDRKIYREIVPQKVIIRETSARQRKE